MFYPNLSTHTHMNTNIYTTNTRKQSSDFQRSLTYEERARGQLCRKLPFPFPCTVVGSLAGTHGRTDGRLSLCT